MFPKINPNQRFTRAIAKAGILASEAMTVIDAGASGGFPDYWNTFKDQIRLIGFEPNKDEYKKCAQTESKKVYPFALGRRREEKTMTITRWPYSSSTLAYNMSFWNRFPNAYLFEAVRTDTFETLDCDSFCREYGIRDVDFIKLDTEGSELEIMEGATGLLEENVLGVLIEVAFCHYQSGRPLFPEIDKFLRDRGFILYDLGPIRLARSSLPPVETYNGNPSSYGQLVAGDALYLRDIVSMPSHPVRKNPAKIIKAVCLFEMFSLQDSAIELMEYALAGGLVPKELGNKVDLLVPPLFERYLSLKQYRALYESLPQMMPR
jgi:FkbM family methyltransferase